MEGVATMASVIAGSPLLSEKEISFDSDSSSGDSKLRRTMMEMRQNKSLSEEHQQQVSGSPHRRVPSDHRDGVPVESPRRGTDKSRPPPSPFVTSSPMPYSSYYNNPYAQRDYSPSVDLSGHRKRITSWVEAILRTPNGQEETKDDDDEVRDLDDNSVDSVELLEQAALQIRTEIRQQEMKELADEAESAAEAGIESFSGRASTFGESVVGDIPESPIKPSPGKRYRLSRSPRKQYPLKRHTTYSEGMSMLRHGSSLSLRRPPPQPKIRVLALRHINEVVPQMDELHTHLKTQLMLNGVDERLLTLQQEQETTKQRQEATKTPVQFLNQLTSWVSSSPSSVPLSPTAHSDSSVITPKQSTVRRSNKMTPDSTCVEAREGVKASRSFDSYDVGHILSEHIHAPVPVHRSPIRLPKGLDPPDDLEIPVDYIPDKQFLIDADRTDGDTEDTVPTSSSSQQCESAPNERPRRDMDELTPVTLFEQIGMDEDSQDGVESLGSGSLNSMLDDSSSDEKRRRLTVSDSALPNVFSTPVHLRKIRRTSRRSHRMSRSSLDGGSTGWNLELRHQHSDPQAFAMDDMLNVPILNKSEDMAIEGSWVPPLLGRKHTQSPVMNDDIIDSSRDHVEQGLPASGSKCAESEREDTLFMLKSQESMKSSLEPPRSFSAEEHTTVELVVESGEAIEEGSNLVNGVSSRKEIRRASSFPDGYVGTPSKSDLRVTKSEDIFAKGHDSENGVCDDIMCSSEKSASSLADSHGAQNEDLTEIPGSRFIGGDKGDLPEKGSCGDGIQAPRGQPQLVLTKESTGANLVARMSESTKAKLVARMSEVSSALTTTSDEDADDLGNFDLDSCTKASPEPRPSLQDEVEKETTKVASAQCENDAKLVLEPPRSLSFDEEHTLGKLVVQSTEVLPESASAIPWDETCGVEKNVASVSPLSKDELSAPTGVAHGRRVSESLVQDVKQDSGAKNGLECKNSCVGAHENVADTTQSKAVPTSIRSDSVDENLPLLPLLDDKNLSPGIDEHRDQQNSTERSVSKKAKIKRRRSKGSSVVITVTEPSSPRILAKTFVRSPRNDAVEVANMDVSQDSISTLNSEHARDKARLSADSSVAWSEGAVATSDVGHRSRLSGGNSMLSTCSDSLALEKTLNDLEEEDDDVRSVDSVRTPPSHPCECLTAVASSIEEGLLCEQAMADLRVRAESALSMSETHDTSKPSDSMQTLEERHRDLNVSVMSLPEPALSHMHPPPSKHVSDIGAYSESPVKPPRRTFSCPSLIAAGAEIPTDPATFIPHKVSPEQAGSSLIAGSNKALQRQFSLSMDPCQSASPIRDTMDDMMKSLSPRKSFETERQVRIQRQENHDFLNNYMYCSKPPNQPSKEQNHGNFCADMGLEGCEVLGNMLDTYRSIVPRRPSKSKDLLSLDARDEAARKVETESWFDVASEHFDGALESLMGSAHAHSRRWNSMFRAPSLRVKKDSSGASTPPRKSVKGIILVKESSTTSSIDPELSDQSFAYLYGMTREEFAELPVTERSILHDVVHEKRTRWATHPANSHVPEEHVSNGSPGLSHSISSPDIPHLSLWQR